MNTKHKCGFRFELRLCTDDRCTLRSAADAVAMIADLFLPDTGPCCGVEERAFTESAAQRLAQLLGELREGVWPYDELKDLWWENLHLLDFVEELLKTQYRTPGSPGVTVDECGVTGIAAVLRTVVRNLRAMAEKEGTV